MGIYIKDMEMPTSCVRCRCIRGCHAVNDRIERMDEQPWIPSDHRHNDCPLVPVPPHGALIDRDDFFATCPELVDGYKTITDSLVVFPSEEGE